MADGVTNVGSLSLETGGMAHTLAVVRQGGDIHLPWAGFAPICEDPIVDKSPAAEGQDSIFCEGKCDEWLHEVCRSI